MSTKPTALEQLKFIVNQEKHKASSSKVMKKNEYDYLKKENEKDSDTEYIEFKMSSLYRQGVKWEQYLMHHIYEQRLNQILKKIDNLLNHIK
tara:strand:- start:66 stop:341 length:276 start_codon:yes stop_codon:yes gene_type:complete